MSSFTSLVAASGALAFLLGCASHAPQARLQVPGPAPARVLALGDSYTSGEGVAARDRWVSQLVERLRARGVSLAEPLVIARTGWTCRALTTAIARERPRGTFQLVTLAIGVNDQFGGGDPERYRVELDSLLATAIALAGGAPRRVIVLSIPDWGVTPFAAAQDPAAIARDLDRFNRVCRDETGRLAARFVDVTPLSRARGAEPAMLAPDGLHPSAGMYAEWAALASRPALDALLSPVK